MAVDSQSDTLAAERSPSLRGIGAVLGGKYVLERELGRGGMARVYEATGTRLGRRVAVKVLHPDSAAAIASGAVTSSSGAPGGAASVAISARSAWISGRTAGAA